MQKYSLAGIDMIFYCHKSYVTVKPAAPFPGQLVDLLTVPYESLPATLILHMKFANITLVQRTSF
jgi:hypothetical protein